jgi:hypothetical protein
LLNLTQSGSLAFEDLIDLGSLDLHADGKVFADLDGGGDDLVLLFTLQGVAADTLGPNDFIL